MKLRRPFRRPLRLIASFLAGLGLLGHGLAMLVASLLLPAAAESPPGFPIVAEICTPGGIAQLELLVDPDAAGEPAPRPAQRPEPVDGCPICTVFAQAGCGDLPVATRIAYPPLRVAVPQIVSQDRATTAFLRTVRPRAPPRAA